MPSYRKRHVETESVLPPPDAAPVVVETAAAASKETTTPAVDPSPAPAPAPAAPAPSEPPQATVAPDDTRARLAAMEHAQEQARHAEQQRLIAAAMALQQPQVQPQQQHEPAAQPQPQQIAPQTAEAVIAASALPERAKSWLREHTDYVSDPAKNQKIQEAHIVAKYLVGQEWTDAYFDKMEELLGFAPQALQTEPARPEVEMTPSPPPAPPLRRPITAQRATEPQPSPSPAPRPAYAGPQVSAPPSREPISMTTGSTPGRVVLTAEEQQIAWESRPDPSMDQQQANLAYARQKARFQQLKAQGQYPER